MRKISELLKICIPFHYGREGSDLGLCGAALTASLLSKISREEKEKVQAFCFTLTEEVDSTSAFLTEALFNRFWDKFPELDEIVPEAAVEVYEAIVAYSEEKGIDSYPEGGLLWLVEETIHNLIREHRNEKI